MAVKESWIAEQAVNVNALVQSGKFVRLVRSEEDTFYRERIPGRQL
mgnify:FL=1